MSALLDPNLDPRGFEEFCLSRQLVREACVSSGLEGLEGLEGPSAFRNSLLAKRSELLACGSELLRISVEDGSQCVRVGLAKGWPQSGAVTSGNCGVDVVLRRGSKLQLVGPGNSGDSKVWELELPEGAADPGELLAAAATAGSCHVLFTKSVQHEAQPAHCLTLVEVRLDDPPIYKFLFQLFGPAPLAVAGNGCVVLSNGPSKEHRVRRFGLTERATCKDLQSLPDLNLQRTVFAWMTRSQSVKNNWHADLTGTAIPFPIYFATCSQPDCFARTTWAPVAGSRAARTCFTT